MFHIPYATYIKNNVLINRSSVPLRQRRMPLASLTCVFTYRK